MNPYQNIHQEEGLIIREFSESVDPIDLMWHRDLKTRAISSDSETDWQIQLENELPTFITENIIPALMWHRIIKGSGNLVLNIREW